MLVAIKEKHALLSGLRETKVEGRNKKEHLKDRTFDFDFRYFALDMQSF